VRNTPDPKKLEYVIAALHDDIVELRHSEILNIVASKTLNDADHREAIDDIRQAYAEARMRLIKAEDEFRIHYLTTHPSFVESIENE